MTSTKFAPAPALGEHDQHDHQRVLAAGSDKAGMSEDGGSISFANMEPEDRRKLEKRVLRKLDIYVIPALTLLWLFAFLDRANAGNANAAGFSTTLGLQGLEFNIGLAIFYVPYQFSEIPSNIALKVFGGKTWLPLIVFCWGIVTIGLGFVQNRAGFYACRVLLGLFEGGLLPGIVLYLSFLYRRDELAMRIGGFYAAASLSGAFGGLLASGFIQLAGRGGLEGWRWIFILEGVLTVLVAVFAFIMLPSNLMSARFLTYEERVYATSRLHTDFTATIRAPLENGEKAVAVNAPAHADEEVFEWREIRRGLKSPQMWLLGWAYFGLCTCLYSFSLFLPAILGGLGYSGTRLQLFTVPCYVPASVMVLVIAWCSDKTKLRMPFILALLPISMIGYIMLLAVSSNNAKYAAVFLIALGVYPAVPCLLAVASNNSAGHYHRATVVAGVLMLCNMAGYTATFIYRAVLAPDYKQAHAIVLGCLVFSWLCIAANALYVLRENKAKRSGQRDYKVAEYDALVASGKTRAPIGDRSPAFIYTL